MSVSRSVSVFQDGPSRSGEPPRCDGLGRLKFGAHAPRSADDGRDSAKFLRIASGSFDLGSSCCTGSEGCSGSIDGGGLADREVHDV